MYFSFALTFCITQVWGFTAPGLQTKPSFALNSVVPFNGASGGRLQRIEGQTRKTWVFSDAAREDVEVFATSTGRPIEANVDLWIGPDYTPFNLKAYSEDGKARPIQTLIGTRKKSVTIEVKNIGPMEFPMSAGAIYAEAPMADVRSLMPETVEGTYIEGGAILSFPIKQGMEQVAILLETDTRQLKAVMEILKGPNNPKQSYQVYTSDGLKNSLYVVFNSVGGEGNTIRIKNISPVEFPCRAYISTDMV